MKTLTNLLRAGVFPKHSFKETNDLVLINTISLSGASICFVLFFVAIPTFEWPYLGLTLFTAVTCLLIMVSNYFHKFQLAIFFFLVIVPAVMMTYVFIFGSIGIELYLIPGATFATYLLYPSKWKSALFFVYLLLLFVSSKLILLWKFDTPVLNELQGVLYFPNIVLALSLNYLATLMFRSFQEDQRIELNRSNQVKQRLISIISHDLRSPVISLKQLLDYAEKVGLEEDEFKEYLKRLTTSVQYTSEMIDKVLFWANNQMKGIEVEKKNFDIGQLVEEVLDVAQESAKQKEVKLNFHRNGELTVDADPEMLRLVLSNVVNNAVKFSPKKVGEVSVGISKMEGFACVEVKDKGIGMSESEMEQIFALEKTVSLGSDGEKGAGIGLVLSKELIEMNGGELLAFRNEERGMRMCITLPAKDA